MAVVYRKLKNLLFLQTEPTQGITRFEQKNWLSTDSKFRYKNSTFFQILKITTKKRKNAKKLIQ